MIIARPVEERERFGRSADSSMLTHAGYGRSDDGVPTIVVRFTNGAIYTVTPDMPAWQVRDTFNSMWLAGATDDGRVGKAYWRLIRRMPHTHARYAHVADTGDEFDGVRFTVRCSGVAGTPSHEFAIID